VNAALSDENTTNTCMSTFCLNADIANVIGYTKCNRPGGAVFTYRAADFT
jgi:hypothetical protein